MHTRDEVRTALDANFKALMDCLGQLTEDELTENVVHGKWTAKDIIAHVWDYESDILPNTVEVFVGYLRNKIGGGIIKTVRGFGYKIE